MSALPHANAPFPFDLEGLPVEPTCDGALWIEAHRTLVVSDLHLEKGSSYAARGQMLPPYDTRATLAAVTGLCRRYRPDRVISLGDSFHDRNADARLSAEDCSTIRTLTAEVDWVWIEGNHDPTPPIHLGGRVADTLKLGPLVFRHEPTGNAGEISGHLHPAARVRGRGRSVRRRCFVTDGHALIMPALGAFTGGLNVRDETFRSIFPKGFLALVLGQQRVYGVSPHTLIPDGTHGSHWRL